MAVAAVASRRPFLSSLGSRYCLAGRGQPAVCKIAEVPVARPTLAYRGHRSPMMAATAGDAALLPVQAPLVRNTRSYSSAAEASRSSEPAARSAQAGAGAPQAAAAVVVLAGAAGLVWAIVDGPLAEPPRKIDIDIKPISEEVFEVSDNLVVVYLDSAGELVERQADIQRVLGTLVRHPDMHRVQYYHNVKKEGDPPLPSSTPGAPAAAPADAPADAVTEASATSPAKEIDAQLSTGTPARGPLQLILYKGQRKTVKEVVDEVPTEEIVNFFKPVSSDVGEAFALQEGPKHARYVSGTTFQKEVVEGSSLDQPVLLQLYEDTCFLCFLMRPFVNELAGLFDKYGVSLVIKRLNVETNDFPDGCPVARGTPTFVHFAGKRKPEKWNEFKPKELVEKVADLYPNRPEEFYSKMDEIQGLVSKRVQLFMQLVMWTAELQKLENLLAAPTPASGSASTDSGADDKDTAFNEIAAEMMAADMKRVDGIFDNLAHLQTEVDEVEHDAALLGVMLGEAVLRRERLEDGAPVSAAPSSES